MDSLKVVFVDDDLEFGKLIGMSLTALGYKVHFQTSLAGMEEIIRQFSPSIIVLDVEIGDGNGIEKAKELIALFPSIPILFVSSHTDIDFITEGIAAGGVNYLKKPIEIKELDAYIKRFANREHTQQDIRIGNYLFYTETSLLLYGGASLGKLTPLEKNGLILLWKNKNNPVSTELLSREIWGREYTPDLDPSVHNLISKLRKFLNKDTQVRIDTIKGGGYQLTVL
ncbi:DNA-binding response regulator, OmpR family, contains REC and winged-helix (wHTH) domain [Porphyromonadaceae bacterium KH3R12]|nr:DNA-binding response regulator, OmpR family, contains REC and winged-helix (wHTH) domain [Porphyromonadaceae bacterium KH3R12]